MTNLTDPIFHDEDKAREHLEAIRWPNGPYCPHCGNSDEDQITKLNASPIARACTSATNAASISL
jgi:Transposase zinc-ribbon domain